MCQRKGERLVCLQPVAFDPSQSTVHYSKLPLTRLSNLPSPLLLPPLSAISTCPSKCLCRSHTGLIETAKCPVGLGVLVLFYRSHLGELKIKQFVFGGEIYSPSNCLTTWQTHWLKRILLIMQQWLLQSLVTSYKSFIKNIKLEGDSFVKLPYINNNRWVYLYSVSAFAKNGYYGKIRVKESNCVSE